MDQIGYSVCHQLSERSLDYGTKALPVCARDTGFFLCFAACFIALAAFYGRDGTRYPSWKMVVALAVLIVPTVVDAVTSYAGLRGSTNAVRLVTGSLAGMGAAALLFPLAARGLPGGAGGKRILARWWHFPLLLAVPAVISLALWPDWGGGYWLWAPLVSASIVFVLLVLNFTLVSLIAAWVGEGSAHPVAVAVVLSLVLSVAELVASNRLHWLVDKFL